MNSLGVQLFLYCVMLAMYGGAIVALRQASPRTKWLALFYLLGFLENMVAFPAALLGFPPFDRVLRSQETTRYLSIVSFGMLATGAALVVFAKTARLPRFLSHLPPLQANELRIRSVVLLLSAGTAGLALLLSASGYFGYYINVSYLANPPAWLDITRTLINAGFALSFLVYLQAYQARGGMVTSEWILVALWMSVGAATAFKTYVVVPLLFVAIVAFLSNRLRVVHVILLGVGLMVAYSVVEPLRQLRSRGIQTDPVSALRQLRTDPYTRMAEWSIVFESLVRRVDYTVTALDALDADRYGLLDQYRDRLARTYSQLPLLAFVPRAIWPGKPLANLGQELSISLSGNAVSSVTPSTTIDSYLWLGWLGVLINAILRAYLLVIAARLFERYLGRPYAFAPVILLVLSMSMHTSVMAHHYISVVRALVGVVAFYAIAQATGIARRPTTFA